MKSSLLERGADAHGRRLLPLALVDRAGHDAFEEEELDALLELPNAHHPFIQPEQERAVVGGQPLGGNRNTFLRYTHVVVLSCHSSIHPFHRGSFPSPRPNSSAASMMV